MSKDIIFRTDEYIFSYRVAGLLIQNNKVLLQKPINSTAYALPGGHVSLGETNENTLIREFKEEINVDIEVKSLQWVGELFFPWDQKPCHQICLYYEITIENEGSIPLEGTFFGIEQLENEDFKLGFTWIDIKDINNIELYPVEAKEFLSQGFQEVKHFIYKEDFVIESSIDIEFATISDLDSWMDLIKTVRWNFPGLETEEQLIGYKEVVIKNINRSTAICAKHNDKVIGIILFSVKQNTLGCMAVHSEYRKKNVATRMIKLMMKKLDSNRDVSVITFREGDEKGIAPRALYKKLGFIEDELCEEFGYPHQRLILPVKC